MHFQIKRYEINMLYCVPTSLGSRLGYLQSLSLFPNEKENMDPIMVC